MLRDRRDVPNCGGSMSRTRCRAETASLVLAPSFASSASTRAQLRRLQQLESADRAARDLGAPLQ